MSTHGQPTTDEVPPPSESPRRRFGPAAIMALLFLGGILAFILAIELFVARRIPPLTEDALLAAEERWDEHGPASYDFEAEIEGAQPGVVHVEVRDGEVTVFTRDGVAPRQRRTWDYWSIPARFHEIERELDMAADPVHEMQATENTQLELRCEFDPRLGYPRQFHRIVYGGGPEVYWRITDFNPR